MHENKNDNICIVIDSKNKELAKLRNRLYITIEEAAKHNKISRTHMWNLIVKGKCVDAYQVGRKWIVLSTWKYKRLRKKAVLKRPAFSLKNPSIK